MTPNPTLTLSTRDRFLITQALYRLDPDTLNDDLPPAEHTTGAELDALANRLTGASADAR